MVNLHDEFKHPSSNFIRDEFLYFKFRYFYGEFKRFHRFVIYVLMRVFTITTPYIAILYFFVLLASWTASSIQAI